MCDAIAVNGMRPVIDKMFPFDQVAEAFRHMASAAHFGKVAIAVGL
jgi:NADPH:quinone reductase-like Zn-dependent oxidoreductase